MCANKNLGTPGSGSSPHVRGEDKADDEAGGDAAVGFIIMAKVGVMMVR